MKRIAGIISLLIILGCIYYSFYSLMPQEGAPASIAKTEFSTERALVPLKEMSKAPHYHGSEEHTRVREFLISELQKLGLETHVQDEFNLNQWSRTLVKPKNIVGVLKGSGNGKSLVLLSHYDSAKVPSYGASDAGSGVVTILESLRAYKASGKTPKNDIIVLFTDAEEIGLNGADIFVDDNPLAKNVGLVLNFEARGSGGPSNMILETNGGNKNLVKAFIEANPDYPVASSLMYSVYKMLPNDTDSTVFREEGGIPSFFFAFIDDHFDYHTANDTYENLDRETLQHQGSYLLPLLHHFADADLSSFSATEDYVYVNAPLVKMISYPFSWVVPMLVIAVLIFIGLLLFGIKEGRLKAKQILRGFGAFFISLLICGVIGYFSWTILKLLYPQYLEIQQGFTYNGHWYIAFFVLLSVAICFKVYKRYKVKNNVADFYVAPLVFWFVINTAVAIVLRGAAYWIIPVFFGLFSFFMLLRQEKPNLLLLTLLGAPALFFFSPLIQFFPVGLGLKMLVLTSVFTMLTFSLLLPVFGFYRWKNFISVISFMMAIGCFVIAHAKSDYTETRKKPNSLLYYQDQESNENYWLTYDLHLDTWTRGYLGDAPEAASKYVTSAAGSKYNSGFSYAKKAPAKNIAAATIRLDSDRISEEYRATTLTILPQRDTHELLVYLNKDFNFKTLEINGEKVSQDTALSAFNYRKSNRLLRYYVADNDSLELKYTTHTKEMPRFSVMEYSYNLFTHPQFSINKRPVNMMPIPFVNTDAIITKKTFVLDSLKVQKRDSLSVSLVEEN
ncbi:peptidase M28 [unidentified eubacterium SCB49]|nr:peptidase M28 [unidentified eubacterium SCB49]